MEEETLRRKLKNAQCTGKPYVGPTPMVIGANDAPIKDEYNDYSVDTLRLRNGELRTILGKKLMEVEQRRKLLGIFSILHFIV